MRRRSFSGAPALLLLALLLIAGVASAEDYEDIDALFAAPEAGTIEEAAESPVEEPLEAPPEPAPQENLLDRFTREPLFFYGSVSTAVGGIAGYHELPPFDTPIVRDVDYGGYVEFNNKFSFRARPDPSTSIQGTFETEYPSGNFSLRVSEIFLSYSLYDLLFFRVGKQIITWGNGRIYDDTNLTENAENGYSFKLTLPVRQAAFTAVVMDSPYWRDGDTAGARDLNYAGQMTIPVGPVEFLAMGLYPSFKRRVEMETPAVGVLGLKTTFLTVDFFHESLYNRLERYTALSGFFKEWNDPPIQFYGEHKFKNGPDIPTDHHTVLNFLWKKFFHPKLDVGLRWNQAWRDNSGFVIPGLKLKTLSNLTIGAALPIYYGNEDSAAAADYREDVDNQFRKGAYAMTFTVEFRY